MSETTALRATGLTIREASPAEYDAVGRVTLRAYAHDYDIGPGYRSDLLDVAGHAARGEVRVAIDAESGRIAGAVWNARAGERLAPVARPGETDFRLLAVDPDFRGRGVGAALTEHLVELARSRGAVRLVMNSGPQMRGAHRLYEKLGFRRLLDREHEKEVDGRRFHLFAFGLDLG